MTLVYIMNRPLHKRIAVLVFWCLTQIWAAHSIPSGEFRFIRRFEISKKICRGSWRGASNVAGMCMFNFQCQQKGGEVIGTCIDGFLFGACCKLPDRVLEELLLQKQSEVGSSVDLLAELQNAIRKTSTDPTDSPTPAPAPSLKSDLILSQNNLVIDQDDIANEKFSKTAKKPSAFSLVAGTKFQKENPDSRDDIERRVDSSALKRDLTTALPSDFLISSTILNKLINDLLNPDSNEVTPPPLLSDNNERTPSDTMETTMSYDMLGIEAQTIDAVTLALSPEKVQNDSIPKRPPLVQDIKDAVPSSNQASSQSNIILHTETTIKSNNKESVEETNFSNVSSKNDSSTETKFTTHSSTQSPPKTTPTLSPKVKPTKNPLQIATTLLKKNSSPPPSTSSDAASTPDLSDPLATWTTRRPAPKYNRTTTYSIPSVLDSPFQSTASPASSQVNKASSPEPLTTASSTEDDSTESLLFWTTRSPLSRTPAPQKIPSNKTYILIKNGTISTESIFTKNNSSMQVVSVMQPLNDIYENVLQQIASNLLKSEAPLKNHSWPPNNTYPLLSLTYDIVNNNTVPVLNEKVYEDHFRPSTKMNQSLSVALDRVNNTAEERPAASPSPSDRDPPRTTVHTPDEAPPTTTDLASFPLEETTPDKPPMDMALLMQLLNLTSYIPDAGIFIPPHLLTSAQPDSGPATTEQPDETTTAAEEEILSGLDPVTAPSDSPGPPSTTAPDDASNDETTTTLDDADPDDAGHTTTGAGPSSDDGDDEANRRQLTTTSTAADGDDAATTTASTTTTKKWNWRKTCGVRPLVREGRIVNGKRSDFGEWPWQALIRESTWLGIFTKNKCGGVLLNHKYVLTAAHCQPGFLASLLVVLGELDVSGEYEPKRTVTRKVKRVVVHRDFVARTFDNDLALLELQKPVKFDEHILPICLPSDDTESFVGQTGFVSGWGRLSYQGTIPNLLHNVEVPVIPNAECQGWFKDSGHSKVIKPEFICAGYKNGKMDSCEGDSGGPLSVPGPDGRWVLAGIVSHGIKCAYPKLPGVYMRMTYYKPWILRVIKN